MVTVSTPGIIIQNSVGVTVEECAFFSFGNLLPSNPAVGLGGFLMQTAVRRNSFAFWTPDAQNNLTVGPGTAVGHLPTIADKPSAIMLTLDLYVQDNFMQCGSCGINLDALCYHAWQVGLSGNFIGPAAVVGIAVAGIGIAAPASRVEITGNEIVVTRATASSSPFTNANATVSFGTGIVCGVSAARISDNDILQQGAASGDGIILEASLLPSTLDDCQVFGNRITGVAGIGLEIRATVGSAMIKQNSIEKTGAGGIVMTGPATGGAASAQHLSIANNQLLGLVPLTSNPMVGLLQYALGIRIQNVAAAEIEGNVVRDLGMDATGQAPRVGIGVGACKSVRISGNQLINIGPLDVTYGPSAGVAVIGPPFDRVEVSNNVIRRTDQVGRVSNDATFWRAVYIGPIGQFTDSFKMKFVQLAEGKFLLSLGTAIIIVPQGEQVTAVRGNTLEGQSSGAVVEVSSIGSCVFTDNQCNLLSPAGLRQPLATLASAIVAASNNVVLGTGPSWTPGGPAIKIDATYPTVMGNITVTAIQLNNAALPSPWAPLNVHIN
jgi:hypothetical protein